MKTSHSLQHIIKVWRILKPHTPTWKMCSLHNAWCCQSRTLPPVSWPRPVPSSGSCTPVLLTHRESLDKSEGEHTRPFTRLHLGNSTWLDVVSDDADVLVTVRTCVFVPEADHVAELVHHDAKLIAVLPYGDGLGAAASPPHVGATPAGGDTVQGHILQHLKNKNWLFPAHIKGKECLQVQVLLDYRSSSQNRFGYEVLESLR